MMNRCSRDEPCVYVGGYVYCRYIYYYDVSCPIFFIILQIVTHLVIQKETRPDV